MYSHLNLREISALWNLLDSEYIEGHAKDLSRRLELFLNTELKEEALRTSEDEAKEALKAIIARLVTYYEDSYPGHGDHWNDSYVISLCDTDTSFLKKAYQDIYA